MLLKVIHGSGDWLILNGNCRFVHLKLLLKSKCEAFWPKSATTVDLCDIETGNVMGLHTLEHWDMAAPCFGDIETHSKIFMPVAMTITYKDDKGTIRSVTPLLDKFADQFPESFKVLKAMEKTRVRDSGKVKHTTSRKEQHHSSFTGRGKVEAKGPKPKANKPAKGKGKPGGKK